MEFSTRYTMREGRVIQASWKDGDGNECLASVREDNPEQYFYQSRLMGDDNWVDASKPMSLADCVLAANVHLGLIPPQNFDPIACPNKH